MIYRTLLSTAIVLVATAFAGAADVIVREQATPLGPIVRLGDVADVQATEASLAEVLANTPLVTTPAQGERRFLRAVQVRELVIASGVDVRELRFSGADGVSIAGLKDGSVDGCGSDRASAPRRSDRAATVEKLTAAVVAHLCDQSHHALWEVKIVADRDLSSIQVQPGVPATVEGGKAPWTGRQRFTLSWPAYPDGVAVTADVQRIEMAVVALRNIERGDLVRLTDVEVRPQAGALPGRAIATTEAAVGKEAVQTIRAGGVLVASQLRAPVLVRRGERVSVRARTGGVTVRTYAMAQQDGSLGDLVMVTPTDSREKYVARVSGVRELEVFAAGATAGDVAAFSR
jgi:flagella basal body P-ring formation protein FlgA